MSRPDLTFAITKNVAVHADFHRKRAVISCETNDTKKKIRIEADFPTLDKIHEEIRKQFEYLWSQ